MLKNVKSAANVASSLYQRCESSIWRASVLKLLKSVAKVASSLSAFKVLTKCALE